MDVHYDLDTGVAFYGDSTNLSYNNLQQPIEYKTWNIDDNGNWALKRRTIDITYDLNGNVTYSLFQNGNDLNGWVNYGRSHYVYSADNKKLSYTEEQWTGTTWIMVLQVTYQYDAYGNLIFQSTGLTQYLYTYNADHLLEQELYQEKVNGAWENVSRKTYAYLPGNSNVSNFVTANWAINTWQNSSRSSFTYDGNGKVLEHIYESWNGTAWETGFHETYTYDPAGFELQHLTQDWNGTAWINNTLISNTYDAENNLIYWDWQSWSFGQWENTIRQFNNYDADNQWITGRVEFWVSTHWVLESYARNHYATFVATQTPNLTDFEVFPNPASSVVTLQGEDLKYAMIFDLSGHAVFSQRLDNPTQSSLQIGHLPSGHYLLQLVGNDGAMSVKSLQIKH